MGQTGVTPTTDSANTELVRYEGGSGLLVKRASGATLSDGLGLALNNVSAYVSVGANASSAGTIRLPSLGVIGARNNAGLGDVPLISKDANDFVIVGNAGPGDPSEVTVGGSSRVKLAIGGNEKLAATSTSVEVVDGISFGSGSATAGVLRLRNEDGIYARNQGGSANIRCLHVNASDQLLIGNGTNARVIVEAAALAQWIVAAGTRLDSTSTQVRAYVPFRLRSYTVLGAPDPTTVPDAMIYVSNETGGAVPAFSDGTNWRRVTDRQVIS